MSLGISMSNNLSIEREIEKFSFIYNLTVCHTRDRYSSAKHQFEQNSVKNIAQNSLPSSDDEQSSLVAERQHLEQSSALSTTNASNGNGSSLAISHPSTITNDWYPLELDEDYELNLLSLNPISESDLENNSNLSKINLDQLFLFGSLSYLIFVLWWLFAQTTGQNMLPFFTSNQKIIPQEDVEFISYIQRSLETIDRQLVAEKKASADEPDNPTVVYVPVYSQAAANPMPSYSPPPSTQAIPLPPPAPSEFTALQPSTKIPLPPPPSESAKPKNAEISPPEDNKLTTAIASPQITSTLVGLIELGEASAALFKIDGITQRIWLGENIENTGWVLESVTKEKATLTNQGKSRMLSIGESL